jgi:universal stress protein A
MKFKPTEKAGGLVVELQPQESRLPAPEVEEQARVLPAFKLKKILVPVDFSACSRKALEYAIPLAEQFGAELTLLHVLPSSPPVPELGPVDVVGIDDATQELEALQASVRTAVPSQSVLRIVRTGDPQVEIIRVARQRGIDLIVLSTHGRTGLSRVLLGSTAEKVVRHAPCPVLVVRQQEHEFVEPGVLESPANTGTKP